MITNYVFKKNSFLKLIYKTETFTRFFRYKHVNLSYSIVDPKSKSTPPVLFPSKPLMLLIHGLFGNKKNFESLAKAISVQTGLQVVTVDARNHGSSEHSDEMDYEVMAEDMHHLITEQLSLHQAIVLGHSMGGKIAMTLALKWPELVRGLVVEDIVPGDSKSDNRAILKMIETMMALDTQTMKMAEAKRVLTESLRSFLEDGRVVDFLLTNLISEKGVVKWRINLPSLLANNDKIIGFPCGLQGLQYSGPCAFIGGANSPYIDATKDEGLIKSFFPQASISIIANAGHWIHSEQPAAFASQVIAFVRSLSSDRS